MLLLGIVFKSGNSLLEGVVSCNNGHLLGVIFLKSFTNTSIHGFTGAIMAAYGGARPKFPLSASRAADKKVIERNLCDDYQADVPSVPNRDQMKDKHSEKEDPLDNMNDLQKDLEELLLGDLIRTEHRQGKLFIALYLGSNSCVNICIKCM